MVGECLRTMCVGGKGSGFQKETLILNFACDNGITLTTANKGVIMKSIMPFLKQNNCDMKIAQEVLKKVII